MRRAPRAPRGPPLCPPRGIDKLTPFCFRYLHSIDIIRNPVNSSNFRSSQDRPRQVCGRVTVSILGPQRWRERPKLARCSSRPRARSGSSRIRRSQLRSTPRSDRILQAFFRPTIPSNVIEFQSSECTNRQISSSYERTPRNIFIDSAETKQGPPLIGVSTQLSETTFSAYS